MAGFTQRHRSKNIDNTGFGTNSNVEGGRLVNPDGSTNLKKRGHRYGSASLFTIPCCV